MTHLIEDLAATALVDQAGDLASEYELLRKANDRTYIVTHSAFEATVAILLRQQNSLGPLLRLLRAEANHEAHGEALSLVLPDSGIISLPFSGIAIDLGRRSGGATIHLSFWPQRIRGEMNGQRFEMDRSQGNVALECIDLLNGPAHIWDLNIGSLRIDAWTDPYLKYMPEDWRVADITNEYLDGWREVLGRATQSLECCATKQWADIKELLGIIVPVREISPDAHLSSSTLLLPQVVFMSWTPDVMQVVEALVHEAGHHKLFLYEETGPLVVSPDPLLLRSPWRSDLRPPRGLIHGIFAFSGVLATWQSFLACSDCPDSWQPRLSENVKRLRGQLSAAVAEIRRHTSLTCLGDMVVSAAESLIATGNG